MAQVVILGAGLTGLTTAYQLEQQGIHDYVVFEKEDRIGGLCRSERNGGFTFDYTGHFLHTTDPTALNFLAQTIGNDALASINRNSAIFSEQRFTTYPYQTNLFGLTPKTIAECVEGFVKKKRPSNIPKDSFAAWVLKHFGSGFAKHFFFPYQEKLLCHSVKTITSSWTGRFVPATSLERIIAGAIIPQHDALGYNAHFYYPRCGGIDHLISGITKKLSLKPKIGCCVEYIDSQKKIVFLSNGSSEPYEYLVSTIPLKEFLEKTKDSHAYQQASLQLQANYLLNINLGVAKPEIKPHHWIYYPEKKYHFFRVGIPHLLTPAMAPAGTSSLSFEIAFRQPPQSINNALKKTYQHATTLFGIEKKDIINQTILTLNPAYVHYDRWRDRNVPRILQELASHHIYSIGRYGAWKYASMQESIIDGIETAHTIAQLQKGASHARKL